MFTGQQIKYDAEVTCKEMGGHLVSLHDEAQMVMLRNALYHLKSMPSKYSILGKRKRQHQHLYFIGLQTQVRLALKMLLFY